MASIFTSLPEWFEGEADVSMNPEILLMRAEQDEDECDVEESMWLSATHVTQPKRNLND